MKAGHIKEPSQPHHSWDSDSHTSITRDCHSWDWGHHPSWWWPLQWPDSSPPDSCTFSQGQPRFPGWWPQVSHSRGLDVSFHKGIYSRCCNTEIVQALSLWGGSLEKGTPGLLSRHSPSVPKSHFPSWVFGSGCVSVSILSIHVAGASMFVSCFAGSWHFPASCPRFLPPRAQSPSHAAGCKPSCLQWMYSSALISLGRTFQRALAPSPFLWAKSGRLSDIVVLAFLPYAGGGKSV